MLIHQEPNGDFRLSPQNEAEQQALQVLLGPLAESLRDFLAVADRGTAERFRLAAAALERGEDPFTSSGDLAVS